MTRLGDALIKAYAKHERNSRPSGNASVPDARPRALEETALLINEPVRPSAEAIQPLPVTAPRPIRVESAWNWPTVTDRLLAETEEGFLRLADRLRHGSLERNITSVVFSGTGRRIGRTTVLLTLARALQEHRPEEALLLIDADFSRPNLARQVGLHPAMGLWEILQSDVPPESVLQIGPGGRLALLPLSGPVTPAELETVGPEGLLPLIAELREQFPLILVDAGPADSSPWHSQWPLLWNCTGLDALVHVQFAGTDSSDSLRQERQFCRESGMEFLGIIDTFAPTTSRSEISGGPPPAHIPLRTTSPLHHPALARFSN